MSLVSYALKVQSENREPILKTNLKTILISTIFIAFVSLLLFKNPFFKSTYLLKSFGEISVDPEIALINNKPTFMEFYDGVKFAKKWLLKFLHLKMNTKKMLILFF